MSHTMPPEEYKHHKKEIYKVTGILSVITIVEVALALMYEFILIEQHGWPRLPLMIFVSIASLVKGYYIMGVFMHMKHEAKPFILTILVPFTFLIWAIIVFSLDGQTWNQMRQTLNSF